MKTRDLKRISGYFNRGIHALPDNCENCARAAENDGLKKYLWCAALGVVAKKGTCKDFRRAAK